MYIENKKTKNEGDLILVSNVSPMSSSDNQVVEKNNNSSLEESSYSKNNNSSLEESSYSLNNNLPSSTKVFLNKKNAEQKHESNGDISSRKDIKKYIENNIISNKKKNCLEYTESPLFENLETTESSAQVSSYYSSSSFSQTFNDQDKSERSCLSEYEDVSIKSSISNVQDFEEKNTSSFSEKKPVTGGNNLFFFYSLLLIYFISNVISLVSIYYIYENEKELPLSNKDIFYIKLSVISSVFLVIGFLFQFFITVLRENFSSIKGIIDFSNYTLIFCLFIFSLYLFTTINTNIDNNESRLELLVLSLSFFVGSLLSLITQKTYLMIYFLVFFSFISSLVALYGYIVSNYVGLDWIIVLFINIFSLFVISSTFFENFN